MAINFPTLPKFTPEEAGALPDLQQAIMQGLGNYMQLQTQPKQMAQDFLAKQLANKMAGVQAQYAEPMMQAQIQKALQPSAAMSKLPYEIELLKAKTEAQKSKTGAGGISRGKLTQSEEKALAGGRVMDYLTPVIQENPYIGVNPTFQIAKDQFDYKFGTPKEKSKAKERLLKFGIASGLVSEQVAGTLLGQRITATVPALAHQRKSLTLGWPIGFEEQASLLPKEIQEQAKTEISKHLKNLKAMPEGGVMRNEASESDPLGIL